MTKEKIITTVNLDSDSVNALTAMSLFLGISKSSVVRLLVNAGWEQFKKNRSLPILQGATDGN